MAGTFAFKEAVQRLKEIITNGPYNPGDKLPTIKKLSDEFAVGESSIREAIRILESLGIVNVRQGSGIYVTEQATKVKNPLESLFEQDNKITMTHLCEVRRIIDPQIATLAALSATPEKSLLLKDITYQFSEKIHSGNYENWVEDYNLFHLKLSESINNPFFTKFTSLICSSFEKVWRNNKVNLNFILNNVNYHVLISEAISNRNTSQAGLLMLAHIDDVIATLKSIGVVDSKLEFTYPTSLQMKF